ncbi:DEAD/DEAH box helicase [Polaribacter tangerinus]|uniref:DEAD/DEAH box helicase n=1 Tax=Polaribacter tangerinus TaxID=1920034 RepID=UPI000B4BF179|nr:DEAD/DEAH box helicase [Polaribacter tangerinus]
MPFKKLHPYLKEKLVSLQITAPSTFQTKCIPTIKSGANVYAVAPEGSGKKTSLILTTLHKLQCKEEGVAPRAVVLVESREKAIEMYESFLAFTRYSDIRVYLGDEKEHIDLLKSEIFEGIDVLVSTPLIMNKLLLLEGLNTTQLKIFNVYEASFLSHKPSYSALLAITQSIHKCQYVMYTDKITDPLKRLESFFMEHAKKIHI